MNDKATIRKRALSLVESDAHRVGTRLAQEFGLSRQVANGYLQAMVKDDLLVAEGTTRAKVYKLKTLKEFHQRLPTAGLREDVVWSKSLAPLLTDLPQNVRNIWQYGVTEIINNAIDHSGAAEVGISLVRNALFCEVTISDAGEGIFLKIQRALGLLDPREAILELAKGKLTTAPERHSGEGIFFTSRAMDVFEIESHTLRFRHAPSSADTLVEQKNDVPGTKVRMRLGNDSQRNLQQVFNDFTESEDATFDRTVVPLNLAKHDGDMLVSRSQAKRVAHRLERFKRVELDFAGIDTIGQAFADELFRIFAKAHPQIKMVPINTSPAVAQMIKRAVATTVQAESN